MTVISLVHSNIVRSKSSAYKKEIGQKNKAKRFLAVILISFITVFIFLYVLQVNNIAAKGYNIRDLKKEMRELQERNRTLQVNISNLKSINVLQSKSEGFNMVKAENVEYVVLPITKAVAAK